MLQKLGLACLVAALTSAVLIILLRPLLARYALAQPNARSSHKVPTPQGGGIAVILAVFVGASVAIAVSVIPAEAIAHLWPIAAGVTLLAITGAADDIWHLPVAPRLVLQFIAVGAVIIAWPDEARVLPFLSGWGERIALLAIGVYFVNVVNFMDGIDWMTVAEVVPATAAFAALSLLGALPPTAAIVAFTLAGAMIGFAPFNRPVAKLFLGDVGSLPVGLLLFWLLAELAAHGHVAAALLIPLYYLADASLTLGRRLVKRENIFEAHRTHFYQRATDRGFSVPQIIAHVFAVNLLLAALAITSVWAAAPAASLIALTLGAGTVAWLLKRLSQGKVGRLPGPPIRREPS